MNATLEVWFPDRAHVSAPAAIVGLGLRSQQLQFSHARVQFTALPALIGTVPLATYRFPPPGGDPLNGTYGVDGNPDASLEWSCDLGKVECNYNLKLGGWDGFRWHVDTIPEIIFEPPEPLTLQDYFENWLTPIRQVVTFLSGQRQAITRVTVARESTTEAGQRHVDRRFKVYAPDLGQRIYTASRPNPLDFRPMYSFKELPYELPLLIDRWKQLTSACPQALKPYLNTLFLDDLPARAVFLYRVQTLEAIHRFLEDTAVYAEHEQTRARVLKRVKELGLEVELRRFLHDRVDRHGGPSLRSRLNDLVVRLPSSVQEAGSVPVLAADVPAIRDDLAHGLKEYEPDELRALTVAMKLVADAHLLKALELAPENALRLVPDS